MRTETRSVELARKMCNTRYISFVFLAFYRLRFGCRVLRRMYPPSTAGRKIQLELEAWCRAKLDKLKQCRKILQKI